MEMYIPKSFRQVLALILCLALLLPMVPVPASATELTDETGSVVSTEAPTDAPEEADVSAASEEGQVEALSAGDVITVIAGSDFQNTNNDHNAGANVVTEFMNGFVNAGFTALDGFLFCGDYDYGFDDSAVGKEALEQAVLNVYGTRGLTGDAMIWVQGNHEEPSLVTNGTLSSSGAHDAEGYGVYVIHEKDYMWYDIMDEQVVKETAAALDTYLDAKVAEKYSKPIFVVSHLPLHYSMRTSKNGDAMYANYIFDVLNEAGADGLNIIFLFGHDHSNGWDDYLGGSAVYLAKGDSINIAQASRTNFKAETLNFTYMNAGYVAYYTTPTADAETDLTMTVFQITEDDVTITRRTTNADHDLKSAGVENTTQGDTFDPDTRVISSPQTIKLNKTFKATATSSETGVSVSGLGVSGVTVEKIEQDVPTGYSAYVTYDITPTGFAEGGTATVTIPVDSSFDASRTVTVIDHETGETQACRIVDGKVTFTTTHFSLYTVAQTAADSASGDGSLKRLVRANSIDELKENVPYVISDYNDAWYHYMLTNTVGEYSSSSGTKYPGLMLAGEPNADTEHVWYLKKVGDNLYPVYGSADSEQYLLITTAGVTLGAYDESAAAYVEANQYPGTYGYAALGIKSGNGYLNRRGGQPENDVATYYSSASGSYWHFDQVVTDTVSLEINAPSTAIAVDGTSKLTPVVTVGGTTATDYTVTWASEDTTVATVTSTGVVTPVKMGQTIVTATLTAANGITLTEPIIAEIPITVVNLHKTGSAVTVYAAFDNVVLMRDADSLRENVPYVVVSHTSDYILTGNEVEKGMELLPEYSGSAADLPVWYVEKGDGDTEYLRFASLTDADNYLIHDGKVTLGAQSSQYVFDQIDVYNANDKTFFIWISAYTGSSKETPASLNQYGGSTSTVGGLFTNNDPVHSRWRFHEVVRELSFSVSPNRETIYPGYTATLTPTVMINDAEVSNNTISWTSSNTSIATVSNGVVTAKSGGNVTITATLTAADGTDLGTSISVEIPIKVIAVTESNGTTTATIKLEKKMAAAAELVAGTPSGPYIITNKDSNWVLMGNMMTEDDPGYDGGHTAGLELSSYNDFTELWYYDGTYLRYGSLTGPYLQFADDKVSLSTSEENAFDTVTLNSDNLSYNITKTGFTKNLNQYGGPTKNVAYMYSMNGSSNEGSAWYLNKITTEERTATISLPSGQVYEGQSITLLPTVTLDGVEQTTYKLKWTSSREDLATVYQGKVTGVAEGTTKIRAAVSSINGETFATEIFVEASVQVIGISSITLSSTTGSVAQRAAAKAQTGVTMTVTYTDGTVKEVPVTVNMLTTAEGARVSTYNADTFTDLTVNYGVHTVSGFTLTVVAPDKPDYPAYPEEGSVFVDKTGTGIDFQCSGTAQIELTAGGIPSKTGADVIIMLDTSSSMTNKVGDTETTRIQVLTESLNNLLSQLQQTDASGQKMDIRVAIADFNGFFLDEDSPYYINPNDTTVNNSTRSTANRAEVYTGNALDASAFVSVHDIGQNPFTCSGYSGATSSKYTLNTHSGTNYDYAFDAVYQLAESVTEANSTGEERDLFVIFMSDGAPFQYNYFSSQSDAGGSAYWNNWLLGTFEDSMYATNANKTYYHEDGLHWMAEAIKGDPTKDYPVIRKNDERDTDHDNWITVPGLGATMYSIGFCLTDDNKIKTDTMHTVIENLASGSQFYYTADTADELDAAFNLISNEIFYAASNAYFIDEMGVDYDLMLATQTYEDKNSTTKIIAPTIEVRSYNVWTQQDVTNGLCAASQVGNRKTDSSGNFIFTVVETVTFHADGTEAYSNKVDVNGDGVCDTSDNILNDGVICANTFWYNTTSETTTITLTSGKTYDLTAETFYWKLGTVSNAQMTLSYYVHLTDSMEDPGKAAGIYDTNAHAEMYYTNYLGNACVQEVATPKLPWQQATVGYGFYLVDSQGNPIVNEETGATGSFERAVKITDPEYQVYLLNTGTASFDAEILASDVLTKNLVLFDDDAKYGVVLNSNGTGSYTIYANAPNGVRSTYVVGVAPTAVTGGDADGETVSTTDYTTADTVVWFAVMRLPEEETDSGLTVNKTVEATEDANEFLLTLEAYATGREITITRPTDIVLVLDQSASMYTPVGWPKDRVDMENGDTYTAINSALSDYAITDFLTQANAEESQVRENAKRLGYYVAVHNNGNYVYLVHYAQNTSGEWGWYYISVDNTTRSIDIDSLDYDNPTNDSSLGDAEYVLYAHSTDSGYGLLNQVTYYKSQSGALYDSVKEFVAGIADSGVNHRIAVVGFASSFYDGWDHYDGTGLYIDGTYYLYDTDYMYKNTAGEILDPDATYLSSDKKETVIDPSETARNPLTSSEYQNAFVSVSTDTGYASVLNSVEAIRTNYQQTCPSAGMEIAKNIFAANPVTDGSRDQIVVLFTDGVPTVKLESNRHHGWSDAPATKAEFWTISGGMEDAINKAKELKDAGIEIYTIGTSAMNDTSTTYGGMSAADFLRYVSSDNPTATCVGVYDSTGNDEHAGANKWQLTSTPAEPNTSGEYAQFVSDELNLGGVFNSIQTSITAPSVDLDETAILKEVLSDYFDLDEVDGREIKVYTAAYDGTGAFSDNANYGTWEELGTADITITSSENDGRKDTIAVTGFNYQAEYLSIKARTVDGEAYYGSKLIVQVPIRTRDGFWGGNNVPTNEDSTAVYTPDDGTTPSHPVEYFPMPEANVPITVTVDVEDKTIYYNGSLDSDSDGKEGDELIKTVTIGGQEVTVNNDGTFTPQADWMDDFANASWADDSTTPSSDLSNTEPKDYTYTVTVTPNSDGTTNKSENPSNIAGNVDGGEIRDEDLTESPESASDTGHVFILVPELTFKDSTTDFGTLTNGYDYKTNDYVDTKWVFMEDTEDTANAPAVSGTAPELTLTYTPDPEDVQDGSFVTDTKVNVKVSIGAQDITELVKFDWQDDCTFGDHTADMDITKHDGTATSNEFWVHVTLNIEPDTVVIDYGLDVVIDVLANDPQTANIKPTLSGIGASADSVDTAAVSGDFGALSIDGSKVRYALDTEKGMQINKEEVFTYRATYSIKDKTVALNSTVTVIPATIIYYEDEFVDYTVWDASSFKLITDEAKQWVSTTTAITADQAQDRPGEEQVAVDVGNIYGYDAAYIDMATYSMGSAKKVTVNEDLFAEAQFTFCGTGFDIISLTSNTTGTILVDVYNAADFAESSYNATPVESFMVDTYYGYKYALCNVTYIYTDDNNGGLFWELNVDSEAAAGATEQKAQFPTDAVRGDTVTGVEYVWIVASEAGDTLYQVPVIKVSGLEYGQYTALISVSYKSALDHQDKGSYDFYLDAIRIYDPANDGATSETVKNAYVADGEGWPEYFELRNLIISKDDFNSLKDGTGEGIVFIDNTLDANNKITYSIEDYTNYGPNNEVYLAPGQSVAFNLDVTEENLAKIHLAMKSVEGTANVTVCNAADSTHTSVTPTEIATATDLYYDITSLNNKTVVITNTDTSGDAILSITNVKVTYTSEHTDSIENSYFTTSQSGAEAAVASVMMLMAPEDSEEEVPETTVPEETEPETTVPEETEPETTVPEDTEPETTVPEETEPETTVPEVTEPEVFTPDKFELRVSDSTPAKGSTVVVTVTTSADVDHITVNGKTVTKYTTSWFGGSRVWSTWFTAEEAGEMDVSVICYNAEDLASETVTETITVSEKSLLEKIWDLIGGWLKP